MFGHRKQLRAKLTLKHLIPGTSSIKRFFFSQFTFGIDDEGVVIDDVELPKWASSPEEFVMLHRAVGVNIWTSSFPLIETWWTDSGNLKGPGPWTTVNLLNSSPGITSIVKGFLYLIHIV